VRPAISRGVRAAADGVPNPPGHYGAPNCVRYARARAKSRAYLSHLGDRGPRPPAPRPDTWPDNPTRQPDPTTRPDNPTRQPDPTPTPAATPTNATRPPKKRGSPPGPMIAFRTYPRNPRPLPHTLRSALYSWRRRCLSIPDCCTSSLGSFDANSLIGSLIDSFVALPLSHLSYVFSFIQQALYASFYNLKAYSHSRLYRSLPRLRNVSYSIGKICPLHCLRIELYSSLFCFFFFLFIVEASCFSSILFHIKLHIIIELRIVRNPLH
jgi:hypothetical protein